MTDLDHRVLESGRGGRELYDRTPPQDLAAEQSVLGGMLLSKDAIADVVEELRGPDFYRPAHELVYDAIIDLYGRGEPADAVTVAAELGRRGELGRVGGAAYLHTLIASVPTAANAGYYARLVRDQAVLRRLVEAGTRIAQLGYATDGGDVDDLVNSAQAEVYAVTEQRTSEDYVPLRDTINLTMEEIENAANRGEGMVGVPTGFNDLDALTNGLHGGQMIIIAARPAIGKSTLSLDMCRSASIKHGLTSVIFSLEMGRTELTMRLLSAEAGVPLQNMRKGTMRDEDWTKVAAAMSRVSEAPLFIDDSPNMSLMEIRAKARRLKQRHDLRLIVVDYLQLMSSGKRVESRQQEVSEFSRALKLLAKELEVPVIAVAQLNRGPEQRTDKKPAMSDLRESGCLTADTRVMRADTGAEVTMGELMESDATDVPVWALDDRLKYVTRHITNVFTTGVKPVYRLQLASGREVKATANHKFLTYDGWLPLGELEVGARVGVPRHVPAPEHETEWDDRKVVMLAHLLGDGSFVKRQPVRYASVDEDNIRAVGDAATAFGITPVRDEYAAARCTTLRLPAPHHLTHGRRNPVAEWLDGMGLFGLRSHEKYIPEAVYSLPKRQIALFLRHLWATDGSIVLHPNGRAGRVYYATTSRRLADGVANLLLRFGIDARIRSTTKPGYRPGYSVDISGVEEQQVFLRRIGVHGARGRTADELLARIEDIKANTNVDTMPMEVWGDVRRILTESGTTHRDFQAALGTQYCGSTLFKSAPSRARMARIAQVLDSKELDVLAVNDLLWDRIVSVTHVGEERVYDATVAGNHNFIANGVAVHNSLEQDADMVMLLHREDAYDRETRPGEADIIVAKHRNGPTDTITVAFQGHYSRFHDMAH
ncbi:replicative DNA helicase [Georgenia satyanarayanai]|uniref:replicative DNA helicase n=1 Tax=Georgenia satyanarayanai TaxID=860221 RepID=UPI00203F0876|nr:replicative DNA helicase [Georgenia satyanarayanai]MCM3661130.1 replicative DNA helicase [Georgenia satyanarayanai]